MPSTQTITFKGYPLIEGDHNTFTLKWGSQPSYGIFACSVDVWEELVDAGNEEADGTIKGDLVFGGVTNEVATLKSIYLVKGTYDERQGFYIIILADKRVLWTQQYVEEDYNTYALSKVISGSDYEVENLNSSSEWTYESILTELGFTGSLSRAITRKPRNIRAAGRTKADVFQILMSEMNYYMLLNPFSDALVIKPLGVIDGGDTSGLATFDEFISKTVEILPTALWKPSKIKALYIDSDGSSMKFKEATVTGGKLGERAHLTSYTESVNGQLWAQDFATELAGDYTVAHHWHKTMYVGIRAIAPSTEVHTITWRSNRDGAVTVVERGFPICSPPQPPSTLFTANGYVMGGGTLSNPQYQYMVYQGVAANQGGWDYTRSHTSVE